MRLLIAACLLLTAAPAPAEPVVPGAAVAATTFDRLDGWAGDDHAAAYRVFRRGCEAVLSAPEPPDLPAPAPLGPACRDAAGRDLPAGAEARAFFERWFEPLAVSAGPGLLTGYYEPEFDGSPVRTAEFPTPLLSLPDDLVVLRPGQSVPGMPPGSAAARRTDGGFVPFPDRAAIEDGALGDHAKPLVFLRDPVDAFIVHVQGSARIRLADGRAIRVAYAGRNWRPYSSVARALVQRLKIPPAEVTADRLTEWLRANPAEARDLLRANRSYIFFRVADELDESDGPVGAAGVPLSAGRSLAVDKSIWTFGLPVWVAGDLAEPDGGTAPFRRLLVAQDSGTAIIGPARGDLFVGSGREAGRRASPIRNEVGVTVLWPRSEPAAARP